MNGLISQELLDELTAQAKASPRLRMNMDLRNSPEDSSQRMLNAILPGSVVPVHRHRSTSETVVCLRGCVDEIFYDDSGHETARFRLDPSVGSYGLQIPAGQWHTLVALQPSVIVEFKDGKFAPMGKEDVWEG
ncbi:MAG: WbuC family cupin fold metalloprotein [Bacteroidales bacterium]|nr:WbuC family cupin fold metalloprotein [Bacteroidales bacterium]